MKIRIVLTEFEAKTWRDLEYLLPVDGHQRSALNRIAKKIDQELMRHNYEKLLH
jgi:hypothetical protein